MVALTLPRTASLAALTRRDSAVDAVRAALLVVVVGLHAFMVGVSRDAAGAPVLENAMDHWEQWPLFTWFVQVMPLFFVLGGFASFTQYSRRQTCGSSPTEYLSARVLRLMVPATVAVTAVAVFLAALTVIGIPSEIVQTAGFRISQPFWFLAVYLGVTALVPAMMRLHRRWPLLTLFPLIGGAITVDIVRNTTGIDAIGLANLAFVWLACQQLGFALADGSLAALSRKTRAFVGFGSVAVVATMMLTGFNTPDLIGALNPPMSELIFVGVAHTMLFLQARDRIQRATERSVIASAVVWINQRAMTIYTWHMLLTIAIAGLLIIAPFALPAPLTTEWWLTRPLWLGAVAVVVFAVTRFTGRFEARKVRARSNLRQRTVVAATLSAITGIVLVLVSGFTLASWVIAVALGTAAISLVKAQAR